MPSAAAPAKQNPTTAFVRQVLGLYHEDALVEARFPDLDLEVLQAAEQELLNAQLEVEACESQLTAAQAARAAKLEQLEAKAQQALAYARVYATGDAELTARLAEVARDAEVGRKKQLTAGERAPPAKRGRPKKNADGAELFAPATLAADGGKRSGSAVGYANGGPVGAAAE